MARIRDEARRHRKKKRRGRRDANYNIEKRRRQLERRQRRRRYLEEGDWKEKFKKFLKVLPVVGAWIFKIGLACLFAFVYVWYFGQKVSTVGDSMKPVLENGDVALVNRFIYSVSAPKRGDIIVFKPKGNKNAHYYIKRIVALPNETIEIIEDSIFIDGEKLDEDYETSDIGNVGILTEKMKLGSDEYFVLGDDRENSEDSRSADIGNVKKSYIYGKAWFISSPAGHMGFVR